MPPPPETRLGPYLLASPLGAGGMGEVYRATDTKLGRDVAIKLPPGAFAADPDRLARFEREAKVLASLNHTGIAHVYGFESATLPDGTTPALRRPGPRPDSTRRRRDRLLARAPLLPRLDRQSRLAQPGCRYPPRGGRVGRRRPLDARESPGAEK